MLVMCVLFLFFCSSALNVFIVNCWTCCTFGSWTNYCNSRSLWEKRLMGGNERAVVEELLFLHIAIILLLSVYYVNATSISIHTACAKAFFLIWIEGFECWPTVKPSETNLSYIKTVNFTWLDLTGKCKCCYIAVRYLQDTVQCSFVVERDFKHL